jgi:hypothetical protein
MSNTGDGGIWGNGISNHKLQEPNKLKEKNQKFVS